MSHVIEEVAGVLVLAPNHANTKHAQTLGMLERSHVSIKQVLRKQASEVHYSIKTSALWSLTITLLTTQALAVSQAECFMDTLS